MKTCRLCGEAKPFIEFYHHKDTGKPQSRCIQCQNKKSSEWSRNNRAKANAMTRDWVKRNPAYARRKWLARYGLTPEAYDALFAEQDGKCKICQVPFKEPKHTHIDHCHDKGHVRGLLCSNCNLGIGNLQHDTGLLKAAIAYLSPILLIGVILLLTASPAAAHKWYDYDCCSEADCHPIPCDQLSEKNKSIWYRQFEFFGASIRPSKDSDCHVCIAREKDPLFSPVPHCVYIQNGS